MNAIKEIDKFIAGLTELRNSISLNQLKSNEKEEILLASDVIESELGVSLIQLQSGPRKRYIVDARTILIKYLRRNLKYTLARIGLILNYSDHTTVMYHLTEFENLMVNDPVFKSKYLAFKSELAKRNQHG